MPGGVHPPLKVIISWPNSHYKHPVTQGPAMVIVTSILGALMLFVVATRLIARAWVQRNFGIDDWIMLIAMIPTLALAISMCLAVELYYFDRHIWDVPVHGYIPARKVYWANDMFYILSSGLIKISILCFYKRMSAGTFSKKFVYIVWGCIAFVVAYMIGFLFLTIFSCRPISAFWWSVDPLLNTKPYHCVNEPRSVIAATSISLIQDFIAATLPMALFATLQIPKRQRIALGAVFAFGYCLCAANGARMYYIYRTFYETYDTTWTAYYIWLWTSVEILLAPICASAPALKVYFRGILKDRSWSTWNSWRRSGSRGWQRNASDPEHTTFQSDTLHSSDFDRYGQSSMKKTGGDSPVLGEYSSVQMEYLSSNRQSTLSTSEKTQTLLEQSSPRGNMTKVERTLGI